MSVALAVGLVAQGVMPPSAQAAPPNTAVGKITAINLTKGYILLKTSTGATYRYTVNNNTKVYYNTGYYNGNPGNYLLGTLANLTTNSLWTATVHARQGHALVIYEFAAIP
jgi:hypothetical protein